MNLLEDIRQFHEKFGLEYNGPPRRLPEELASFRTKFLAEELGEYAFDGDLLNIDFLVNSIQDDLVPPVKLENALDALVDLVYVALGTAYLHGFDFAEAWRRVHHANMQKIRVLREVDSKRGSIYDVVKPENFVPPDLSDLVNVA
jgi:predicted HAD superfamily Cof-like phosphohydrolase